MIVHATMELRNSQRVYLTFYGLQQSGSPVCKRGNFSCPLAHREASPEVHALPTSRTVSCRHSQERLNEESHFASPPSCPELRIDQNLDFGAMVSPLTALTPPPSETPLGHGKIQLWEIVFVGQMLLFLGGGFPLP